MDINTWIKLEQLKIGLPPKMKYLDFGPSPFQKNNYRRIRLLPGETRDVKDRLGNTRTITRMRLLPTTVNYGTRSLK